MSWFEELPITDHRLPQWQRYFCESSPGMAFAWVHFIDQHTATYPTMARMVKHCQELSADDFTALMTMLSCLSAVEAIDEIERIVGTSHDLG